MLVAAKGDLWVSPLHPAEPQAAPPAPKEVLAAKPNPSTCMAIPSQLRLPRDEGGRGIV